MIRSAEVSKLAHQEGVGARVIEKDYVLSWLLAAIAESKLRDGMAFKGGTALKRMYYPDYRFSEDLDFTVTVDRPHEELVKTLTGLFPRLRRQVNLNLTLHRAELSVFDSTTLLINYVGPLRARSGSRNLKMDFTRGELLLYPTGERPVQAPYSDYPSDVTLLTYALEEVLIEKLCALMGRTEPRDLYDVYWLFEQGEMDLLFVPANFALKSQHKGHDPERLAEAVTKKERAFGRLWTSRLAVQVQDLPPLKEVLRVVRRHLRRAGLI